MKYRAKITSCAHLIDNLYDFENAYICKDERDTYVDVKTEEEADLIEQLNRHQEESQRIYRELQKAILKTLPL